jgi:hypothetical protein
MTWQSAEHVLDTCREEMASCMIEALRDAQTSGPRIPRRYYAAANAGVIEGLADALIELICVTSRCPDTTASVIANRIRRDVASMTSASDA